MLSRAPALLREAQRAPFSDRPVRYYKQVEVVVHQNVAMEFDGVDVDRLIEQLQKSVPVSVIPEEILLFIASARDVVKGVWVLYAKRPCHAGDYDMSRKIISRLNGLLPKSY